MPDQTAARPRRPHRLRKILLTLLLLLLLLYTALVYVLVSAALVPSFMERLDAFQEITEKSVAQQVHTSDLQKNHMAAQAAVDQWLTQVSENKVTITSDDGYHLVASEFLQKKNTHKWVLVLHGYTGWKEEMYPFACWYYRQGYNVLAPDLRCQGESEGDFIGMGLTDSQDCMGWLDLILKADPDARILLHGQSMGAATALILSGREDLPSQVQAVVSDCSYTDAYSMFGQKCQDWFHLPAFPLVDSACIMLRLRGGYDLKAASPIDSIAKSRLPILIIHGDQDAMIDVDMAYRLNDAAPDSRLLIVGGAGHAQAQDKDPVLYYGTIDRFLAEHRM